MKKVIIVSLIVFLGIIHFAKAQDIIPKNQREILIKQINGLIPQGWVVITSTDNQNEVVLQSTAPMDLTSPMTANDPPEIKELCQIYILIVNRVSPDSINNLRANNEKLKNKLPPQDLKDNLKKWYKENEKTLRILDSEPTHYDDKFSYRIKCDKVPKANQGIEDYKSIMEKINNLFIKYEE